MDSSLKLLVAMAHVADVKRSVEWYELLGFRVQNTFTPNDTDEMTWASLASGAAHLMLTKASEPVVARQQAVLFYLYYEDVHAIHAALKAQGLPVGDMTYPFYCPKGEFPLTDPDGYCLMLTHV